MKQHEEVAEIKYLRGGTLALLRLTLLRRALLLLVLLQASAATPLHCVDRPVLLHDGRGRICSECSNV